jgi:hypothetical protein
LRHCATGALLIAGCAAEPPPARAPAPAPEPAAAPAPAAAPTFDAPVHDCGQDPAHESPIVKGKLGDGERVVRVINRSGAEVQARLLDESLNAAVAGTLHIPGGETGEFYVGEGVYVLRYRFGGTCEVRRGAKLVLRGNRAGVEIGINSSFDAGTQSNMRKVAEPL